MSARRQYKPALKNSVNSQLQTAFEDSNWPTVVRLAEKQAKAFKDPYYEAIKICAETKLDSSARTHAILAAVDQLKKAKEPLDLATLELYEWASEDADVSSSFSETFGPLRARWAKANAESPQAIQCLQACVSKWDLENAQQIAAALDKAHSKASSRHFMYWNMMLMFLLSRPTAQLTESVDEVGSTARGLKLEEEFNLYYTVLLTHGSKDDYRKQIQSPKLGAIVLFENGYKFQFLQALRTLTGWGDWDIVFGLCDKALSLPTDSGAPSYLASDWHVWKAFIGAAVNMQNTDASFQRIQHVMNTYTSARCSVADIYRKNAKLAILEMTFRNPRADLPPSAKHRNYTSRVVQLGLFLEEEYTSLSVFDDIKDYFVELSHREIDQLFLEIIPKMSVKKEVTRSVALKTLTPQDIWAPLDIKRTIQDALSPHFFDRISTLSPGLFQSGRPPTDSLRSYYVKSLRDFPKVVWDGFLAGSYSSVLELVDFNAQLRRSCTAAMTLIEERRATRVFGGKMEVEVKDLPVVGQISNDTACVNVTDYAPFPDIEGPNAAAIYELVQIGPELSNERSHLGGKTGLHNDVVGEFRALETVATKTLAVLKGHIKTTKDKLGQSGWLDRVLNWTFGPEDEELDGSAKMVVEIVGGRAEVEEWAAQVVQSWRDTVKGWGMVRME
ncbi:hypothetical protein P8C59_007555 [Phyllachora maydis]|uniref:Uncharacterized protein n=1 Tax=Phyllachora maydis TaxID=1825666 RepID=A0AAD9MH26_9PEZI|nr:hypothetical protein P8C59_007555 [Phyllachora maydis]